MSDLAKRAPSRHGTFLGDLKSQEYQSVVAPLNRLIEKALDGPSQASTAEKDFYEVLRKVRTDLEGQNLSAVVKDGSVKRFSISGQEVAWMLKHDQSVWLDYIAYRYRFKVYPSQRKLTEFPLHLLIEPTSACNLRCIMCFQVDTSFTKKRYMGLMPWDLFKNVADQAIENRCNAITLASRGEPTLHKQFGQMLRYLGKAKVADVKINTNATKLKEPLIHDILSAGVSEVVFSVDAATKATYERIRVRGKFDEVLRMIELFSDIRAKHYPKSTTTTRITGIKVDEEQDLNQMHAFWSKYVDEVTIKNSIPRWDSYNNEPSNITAPCTMLWERMYVWYDGTVNPCDFDYKSHLAVGDAKKSSLKQIWEGEAFGKLREDHLKKFRNAHYPCDRCPLC